MLKYQAHRTAESLRFMVDIIPGLCYYNDTNNREYDMMTDGEYDELMLEKIVYAQLKRLRAGSFLDITILNDVAAALGFDAGESNYNDIRKYHCVDWDVMGDELAEETLARAERAIHDMVAERKRRKQERPFWHKFFN